MRTAVAKLRRRDPQSLFQQRLKLWGPQAGATAARALVQVPRVPTEPVAPQPAVHGHTADQQLPSNLRDRHAAVYLHKG